MYKAIVALCVLVFCCISMVLSGILSKREILTEMSPPNKDRVGTGHNAPFVDQVVLILVDAMRPDFVFPSLRQFAATGGYCDSAKKPSSFVPYGGPSITYIESILRKEDARSRESVSRDAYGTFLVADAPTTTSQRLKAIVTGTIPAFIEAGANFNSDDVIEDSLIHQLERANGEARDRDNESGPDWCASVLGDDTWLQLFQRPLWKKANVFPSFDVRDLDSNDAGVLEEITQLLTMETPSRNIPAESRRYSPLIISHFLGVDHAGHRFNAQNEHMDRKLTDVNHALRNISRTLTERAARSGSRTMMIVIGDHGMTNSGDHGGDSPQETDTFMFSQLFGPTRNQKNEEDTEALHLINTLSEHRWKSCSLVDPLLCRLQHCAAAAFRTEKTNVPDHFPSLGGTYQIDLVPTIASLLGVAIPFSNIGRAIPEVLSLATIGDGREQSVETRVQEALLANYEQLIRYLSHPRVNAVDGIEVHQGSYIKGWNITTLIKSISKLSHNVRESRTHMKTHRIWIGSAIVMIVLCLISVIVIGNTYPFPADNQRTAPFPIFSILYGCLFMVFTFTHVGFLVLSYLIVPAINIFFKVDQYITFEIVASILLVLLALTVVTCVLKHHQSCHLLISWKLIATALKHIRLCVPNTLSICMSLALASMIVLRIICPLSNSLVVFEDRVLVWIICVTVGVVSVVKTINIRKCKSMAPVHWIYWHGLCFCFIIRILQGLCVRERQHGTHVMAQHSSLDGVIYYLTSGGIQPNSGVLIGEGATLLYSIDRFTLGHRAVLMLVLRLVFNSFSLFGCVSIFSGIVSSTKKYLLIVWFIFTCLEGTPIVHPLRYPNCSFRASDYPRPQFIRFRNQFQRNIFVLLPIVDFISLHGYIVSVGNFTCTVSSICIKELLEFLKFTLRVWGRSHDCLFSPFIKFVYFLRFWTSNNCDITGLDDGAYSLGAVIFSDSSHRSSETETFSILHIDDTVIGSSCELYCLWNP